MLLLVPVLVPLNLRSSRRNLQISGLDKLSLAGLDSSDVNLLWIQFVVAVFAFFVICCTIYREYSFYLEVRHLFLSSGSSPELGLIITDISSEDQRALMYIQRTFSGQIQRIDGDVRVFFRAADKEFQVKLVKKVEKSLLDRIQSVIRICFSSHKGLALDSKVPPEPSETMYLYKKFHEDTVFIYQLY